MPPVAGGEPGRRARLARLPGRAGLVRLVDHVHADAAGRQTTLATEAMRADAVLVAVPVTQRADDVAERLHEAGFATEPFASGDAVVCVRVSRATVDGVPDAIAAVAARVPGVTAEPDYLRFSSRRVPGDYDATRLWGLEQIEAPAAWTVTTGSPGAVVAVIDSGITPLHPDLAANLWTNPGEIAGNGRDDDGNGRSDDIHGWNFANNNAAITDTDGHGTHVAGTIGGVGDNGTGVVGVNWNVRIMVLRAGSDTFADSALLNALRYVVAMRERGIPVVAVNMSLGGAGMSNTFRTELAAACDAGILAVAAAGNLEDEMPTADNDVVPIFPASYDVENVIAVASTNQADRLSVFSHYGATSVDLAAPGTAVYSTVTDGGYAWYNGTSMAAPHVTGAVALVAAANPGLDALQIRDRILSTVDRVSMLAGRVATGGRLNLRRAVSTTLLRPRVAISRGGFPVEVALIDRAGLGLDLTADLLPEGAVVPAATLAWSMADGPAAATFTANAAADTVVTFPAEGLYRIRVVATAGALSESDEVVVAVGDNPGISTSGLQAWWPFDDNGGSTADASGNGRTGTVVSAARSETAVFGTSMQFDGLASRVAFGAPAQPRLSIAGWARAAGVNSATIFPRIVHMRQGLLFGGFDSTRSTLDDGNNDTLKFALDDGVSGVVWHSPPGTFQIGTWFHVAVTYDPSTARPAPVFYINGVRQVTGSQASTVSVPSVDAAQGYIGDRGDGTRGWLGQLDELRLYGRILGDAEIAWMAREATVRALADGSLVAGTGSDPLDIPLSFTAASSKLEAPALVNAGWSISGASAIVTTAGSTSAIASFGAPGSGLVRFDATTADGVHVVRTLAIEATAATVQRQGYYSGTTSTGGIWTLLVRSDGVGTFLASGAHGSFQRDFIIPEWGVFTVEDRTGAVITGRIFADGRVAGSILDQEDGVSTTFSGERAGSGTGAADPELDGIYSGWVVDSGARSAAQVEGGRISIVIEESGPHRAASGALDATGAFTLSPADGAVYSGRARDGRLDADITLPGEPRRSLVLLRDGVSLARRLVNIAVRGFAGTGDSVLISGFVVRGGSLPVLVRGVGPGLAALDVSGVLGHASLVLRGDGLELRNAGWSSGGQAAEIAAASALTGAFALQPGSADAALLMPLGSGAFTVQVNGADGGTGVALAEVYDARTGPADGALVNISGRGFVGTGDNLLIGGFVVAGEAPVLVLVRAAGPGLIPLDVSGVLARPHLRVLRGSAPLADSESWALSDSPATIALAAGRVGAFAFEPGSEDAALLLFLPPGPYTAQVSGADGGTGVALLEIYQVEGM